MIEQGEHDFVAGDEFAADGAADGVGERGHVLTENDFIGIAIEKISHGGARGGDHLLSIAAGGISAPGVGVVAGKIIGDGGNHLLRDLRAAGAIEKNSGVSVNVLCERGELGADPGQVERDG